MLSSRMSARQSNTRSSWAIRISYPWPILWRTLHCHIRMLITSTKMECGHVRLTRGENLSQEHREDAWQDTKDNSSLL